MTKKNLSYDRVKAILEAYGADPSRWPQAERTAMKQAVSGLAEFSALQDRQAALDRQLDRGRIHPDTAALEARILAGAPQAKPGARHSMREHIPAYAAAASLIAGSLLGFAVAAAAIDRDAAAENLIADAFAAPNSAAFYSDAEV